MKKTMRKTLSAILMGALLCSLLPIGAMAADVPTSFVDTFENETVGTAPSNWTDLENGVGGVYVVRQEANGNKFVQVTFKNGVNDTNVPYILLNSGLVSVPINSANAKTALVIEAKVRRYDRLARDIFKLNGSSADAAKSPANVQNALMMLHTSTSSDTLYWLANKPADMGTGFESATSGIVDPMGGVWITYRAVLNPTAVSPQGNIAQYITDDKNTVLMDWYTRNRDLVSLFGGNNAENVAFTFRNTYGVHSFEFDDVKIYAIEKPEGETTYVNAKNSKISAIDEETTNVDALTTFQNDGTQKEVLIVNAVYEELDGGILKLKRTTTTKKTARIYEAVGHREKIAVEAGDVIKTFVLNANTLQPMGVSSELR